ncbi:hypothetical protein AMJ39_01695 [candidate division TA06 bacterium DG_24]|jgi:uncharacterized damage-inducible protein DinB|uniref:Damage-inducible protein DinB n=3 Tax=Bacteria division TA06 TaxID=1156500 RepID=A0A0S8JMC5_UNCT6|nr:MAG: hypothetical protein AMJ39_01695 [candidate division TA06 bacterium DG_24]KPK71585.1 MAG: hypothetical protein AMJ82_00420 [candidate division TA06 bacterium SM23_40]KPL09933.1 MAG: hypothetical protein AMJ71_05090 [candidate division TA06 bacterium SM1_40]
MFRKLDDFLKAYEEHREGSRKILGALTDENINQPVASGHRTLGHVAWHMVATIPEMMNHTGLGISSVDPHSPPPTSAPEIAQAYEKVTAELVEAIKANWTDETLLEIDEMYGEKWPRGTTLGALLSHEVHHRGQITVLLRQAGQKVPGCFGPAKEEWEQYGMEAPPY